MIENTIQIHHILLGEDLLYLLDAPHTKGNVQCDPGLANYKGYPVMKLYFNIHNAF